MSAATVMPEVVTYRKTYGVQQCYSGRWAPVLNGTRATDLSYASRAFALNAARQMMHKMHYPFVDFLGRNVRFEIIEV
jgi:hypothetical protein